MDWVIFLYGLIASVLLLIMVFFIAKRRDRYDLIDVAWGLTFIAIAGATYMSQSEITLASVQTVALILVGFWGYRLSRHIYARWSVSKKEDGRYTDMRDQYANMPGGVAINMFVRVYLVQAILAVAVSSSVLVLFASAPAAVSWLTLVGTVVWLIGFYFEVIGDAELKHHLANPKNKGKLMTTGLWRYTRHPNYFGEMTQWWGIFIVALSAGLSFWYISIIGPIVITTLLLFISGVPLTEKRFAGRPGWDEYKRKTSKVLLTNSCF